MARTVEEFGTYRKQWCEREVLREMLTQSANKEAGLLHWKTTLIPESSDATRI